MYVCITILFGKKIGRLALQELDLSRQFIFSLVVPNTLQNAGFEGNFTYNEGVCFTEHIYYNNNTKVQKQNETEVKKL